MNSELYDYRSKNLYLTDPKVYATLSNLAREDGAIVIDWSTGQILGGNYSIFDLSEAQDDMTGGTRHRSASSCAQITGGFVIVASEAECKKLTNAEHLTVFYGNKVPREESLQEQPNANAPAGGGSAGSGKPIDRVAKCEAAVGLSNESMTIL